VQQAIAVLDSGVGGLTVVTELFRQLPQEKIIYFGDTARAPYGPRTQQEVLKFTYQIVDYLLQFDPKLLVIACNTATAAALEDIRCHVSIPVIGVVHPGARAAVRYTKSGIIGVIGTEGTVRSGAYESALLSLSPTIKVHSLACPSFVTLVEQARYNTEEAQKAVESSLIDFRLKPIDCLILGCTHYPFLSSLIQDCMGKQVKLVNSADETAREISTVLHHRGQLAQSSLTPVHHFFCSGHPALFQQIAWSWLGSGMKDCPVVSQVSHLE